MDAIGFFGVVAAFIVLGLIEAAFDTRAERRREARVSEAEAAA